MDVAIWSGALKGQMQHEFPITLGRDFSGTVARIGAQVSGFSAGDQVFGVHFKTVLHDGTFAEQVLVPASTTAKRPADVDGASAGALGLAGITARMAVDAVSPSAGETVLISGATGGVGAMAIQMVKATGAKVIATASRGDTDFVRSLGADEVVDHTTGLAGQIPDVSPDGVHGILHLAGDGLELAEFLAEGGRLASTLGLGQDQFAGRPVHASAVMAPLGLSTESLGELVKEVSDGRLRVPITKTYALDQVGDAIKRFTSGTVGKLAIAVR